MTTRPAPTDASPSRVPGPESRPLGTRPGYDAIPLYTPGAPACATDVSDTLNLWGTPPAALRALRDALDTIPISHYPSLYNADLKAPIAAYAGVRADEVVTGTGSDNVLDCAIRAYALPGGTLAHTAPTFAMVPLYARSNGLTPVAVPLVGDDYAVDADALLATNACVIYLCSPNNPSGTPAARDAVLRVVERAPGLVIIDEAYAEFLLADPAASGEVFTPSAPGWERVICLRTLSKAFGLAGLRMGYGVAAAPVVREVEKARGPFMIGLHAERAAVAALGAGPDALGWVQARAADAVAQRNALLAATRAMGLVPAPSVSNFVLLPVPNALDVATRLRAHDVSVRVLRGMPQAVPALRASGGEGFRVGAAPEPIQRAFLDALGAVFDTPSDASPGARA